MRWFVLVLAGTVIGMPTFAQDDADSSSPILETVREFLLSLSSSQLAEARVPFNSEERLGWHYVPRERPGLSLKTMSPEQKGKALKVVRAALSAKGFDKTEAIRTLDSVLRELENSSRRDPELYDVAVFGEPSETEPWGLRYEGHHVSLNWTFIRGAVIASTPQFLGANPAEVLQGVMKGTRVLAAEEDLGRSLVLSLSDEQRRAAVLDATAPPDILTGSQREAAIQDDLGVSYGALTEAQQGVLLSLINEYAAVQPAAIAKKRLERIRASGLDTIKFAWMGGVQKGQGHYYRIQGPTFLIEYDNTQNNANHVHTVWRDFANDFGQDVLKQHYRAHADAHHPGTHEH